jgi:hypothetical protein
MTKSPIIVSRRTALGSVIGAAAAGFAPPARTAGQTFDAFDLSNPNNLLAALAKMRGSTDGSVSMGWVIGTRYAVVNSLATPVWGILAGTFSRYQKVSDDTYEVKSIEVAYFTDLETGKLKETWDNPFTDTTVELPQTRMGPSTFTMTTKGLNIPSPSGEASGMFINHEFKSPVIVHDDVWITEEIQVDGPPMGPGAPKFAYNEMTAYQSTMTELSDPDAAAVPTSVQYQSLVSFRPWMAFGDVQGHTTARGGGRHILRVEEFPKYYLELTEKYHADVLNDPIAVLEG